MIAYAAPIASDDVSTPSHIQNRSSDLRLVVGSKLCELMQSPNASGIRLLNSVAGALLGFAMLLLLRPYPGIAHDSILYMGQGVAQLQPDIFSQDLFFAYGSQTQYSLMPWLLGKSFALATPPIIFLWGTLFSLLFFSAASWFALSALLPERQRYWAWLGVICLPPIYGVVSIFGYNENFLTSRPFAESLCLLTLGFLVRRRWLVAGFCLLAAGLCHPLQAIAAVLVAWPWAVMRDRRWLHAIWLIIPVMLLATAGVRPFEGLLQAADPTWLATLRTSRQLFITLWTVDDFKALGFDVTLLALGWQTLRGTLGRWCAAALCGLAFGMGASLILVDCLHLVLPASLQLWRVQWLAHWLGIATVAVLLFRHLEAKDWARAILLALAAQLAWGETEFGWLILVVMYLALPWMVQGDRARLKPLLTWLFGLGLALLFANHAINEVKWFVATSYRIDVYPIEIRLLLFPAVGFGLPLLGVYVWERLRSTTRKMLLVSILIPLIALGAARWDARLPVDRAIERSAFRTDVFGTSLPVDAQVFLEPENLVVNWLVLGRASYFSSGQLAGQMFNRATFEEGRERKKRVFPLIMEGARCRAQMSRGKAKCHISDASLSRVCKPGPTSAPDYLILPYEQPQDSSGEWEVLRLATGDSMTYRLYSCAVVNDWLQHQSSIPYVR